MKLIQKETLEKWEATYSKGTDKKYPSIDLLRLNLWFFKNPGEGRVLEYACGTGVNTIYLLESGYTVDAVDACQGSIDLVTGKLAARDDIRDRATLTRIDPEAERIPFEDNTFDFLVCVSLLSLLGAKDRVEHMLGEFRRVVKPGGKLILDINDSNSDFSGVHEYVGDNVYLFRGAEGKDDPVPTYCLPDLETFVGVVEPFFTIADKGWSGHEYMGSRINEWILCCENDK